MLNINKPVSSSACHTQIIEDGCEIVSFFSSFSLVSFNQRKTTVGTVLYQLRLKCKIVFCGNSLLIITACHWENGPCYSK